MRSKVNMNVRSNNGIVVGGDNNGVISIDNQANSFSYDTIIEIASELKNKIKKEQMDDANKINALKLIDDIEDKAKNKKSNKIIGNAFECLKAFLINVGCGLMVEYIKYKTIGMF